MKELLKLKRNFVLLLFPLSILILFLAKKSEFIAEEIFSKRIYYIYSIIVSRVTGILPFSVGEVAIILMPIIVSFLFVVFILRLIKEKKKSFIVGKAIINILCFASILFFLYMIGGGVNYYRYTFTKHSNLKIQESTKEELYELVQSLAQRANSIRELTKKEDENGAFALTMSFDELGDAANQSYKNIAKTYPVLGGWYSKPKALLLSNLMSRMQLTGIFPPFTIEANVNVAIPDYSIASTLAHEMAHQRGFMREDEANYIAYLVCSNSEDLELQYSGIMLALIVSGNALYDKDVDLYRQVSASYSNKVRTDLNANTEYWKQYENKVISNTAEQVNNMYLKLNAQEDGVQSYGRMVDLLLAEFHSLKQGE